MSVARGLIQLHQGSISVRSGDAPGSEFAIELPLCAAASPDDAEATGNAGAQAAAGLRILIADDNPDGLESLALLLGLAGHETRTARDGFEALLVAQAFRPQVAFLDIGMPNLDGYETARRLRTQPWARNSRCSP